MFVGNQWLSLVRADAKPHIYLNASCDNTLRSFNHLLSEHAHLNMYDEHIWFSILKRPNCSRFTRLQRLTCCLSVLFLAMTTNAMWFGTTPESGNPGVNIGPVRLTYHTFFVSIMGAAVVVPLTLLMVALFRLSGKTTKGKLSRWCRVVAYFLAFAVAASSSFICILYSLQWGREKSSNWLISMFLSFVESVVVIQPIKASIYNVM